MTPTPHSFDNNGKRIGIFVIAYNAESHITQTLDRIPEAIWDAITVVYVVDDCSTDETTGKALEYGKHPDKLVVIRNRVNRRYGGNQKFGYQWAIDQNLDVVVMLHADGQYAPEMLPQMLAPMVGDEAEVVIGSRMMEKQNALKGGMPKYKFIGNIVLTRIESSLTGLKLSEYHSGYRAYSTALLKKILFWENADEWHFDTQILLQCYVAGARIKEIPIPTYYGDEICHVNGIAYGLNCILTAFGFWLFKHGIYYSRKYDINQKGQRYFEKFDDPYSSHTLVWKKLQQEGMSGRKVLELGVGDASLTRRLNDAGAVVDGVEVEPLYVELAKPYCRRIFSGDLNDVKSLGLEGEYDIIVAADVLEHLIDPEQVLAQLKAYIKKGGLLVVSLPNIANIYIRLSLLAGRFRYHTKGILDRTHLHFYTIDTARLMLRKTGWIVEAGEVTAIPFALVFPFLGKMPFRLLLSLFYAFTRLFKGLMAYQSVWYCRNPNRHELL
jgi:glycosyltransferase involved in cell wall biosynthesis